ncbi:hypothetical protein PRZ48_005150 [Zasmidium cellare]|uniref:Ketoreductase domain-containing protein n=1 Tax=Zasmidium cellare TaxID=395010 RepID=A0ABR0ERL3_ZASCE|nr:hypothetical protein PRZ48_005150 [Zasmidium cellare]
MAFQFPSFTPTFHHDPYAQISPLRPELSVKSKTVVITGGGTGIGKAIAQAFSQAGASHIAILGRRENRLKDAVQEIQSSAADHGQKVLYEVADLGDREATVKAFDAIVETFGSKIDICVSNAGTTPKPGLIADLPPKDLFELLHGNVLSTLNTAHAFLPRAAKDAYFLNVSTGLVHMLPRAGIGAHAASKAAAMKLVEYIQAENPELHVVSLQPGSVPTEATANMKVQGKDSPDLPGQFCVWLVSEEAKFLKGKYVWANWDVRELMGRKEEIQGSRLLTIMLEGMDM